MLAASPAPVRVLAVRSSSCARQREAPLLRASFGTFAPDGLLSPLGEVTGVEPSDVVSETGPIPGTGLLLSEENSAMSLNSYRVGAAVAVSGMDRTEDVSEGKLGLKARGDDPDGGRTY